MLLGQSVQIADIPAQQYVARPISDGVEKIILADLGIKPETLNLTRKGVLTAFIKISKGFGATIRDIDFETITLSGALLMRAEIDEETETLVAKFSTQDLAGVSAGEEIELKLQGNLLDGTPLEGKDTIRVISNKRVEVELSLLLADLSKTLLRFFGLLWEL